MQVMIAPTNTVVKQSTRIITDVIVSLWFELFGGSFL
jgi:hypothetical protein